MRSDYPRRAQKGRLTVTLVTDAAWSIGENPERRQMVCHIEEETEP